MIERICAIDWYCQIEVAPRVVAPGSYDPKPWLEKMGLPTDLSPFLRDSDLMQFYLNDELRGYDANWWVATIECLSLKIESCGFRVEFTAHWAGRTAFKANPLEFSPHFWY
jgi:hypothetical protein